MSQQLHLDPAHDPQELMRRAVSRVPAFLGGSIQVDVCPDGIILSGVVGSYYHKQLAQESLRQSAGQMLIQNRLAVRRVAAMV